MRIRTQLVIAFLALAIVPLVVIVGWSYASSSRAVTRAVLEEATVGTRSIENRLQLARARLTNRFTELEASDVSGSDSAPRVSRQFGEMAPLLDSLIILPPALPPAPPSAPAPESDSSHATHPVVDVEAIRRDAREATESALRGAGIGVEVQQLERSIEQAQNATELRAAAERALTVRHLARERTRLVLGHELRKTLEDGREVVADVHPEGFLRTVLVTTGESDDISFAIDRDGQTLHRR